MSSRGVGPGVSVLSATSSAQASAELAELDNVVVARRMDDTEAARHLAAIAGTAGAAGPRLPPDGLGEVANLAPGPAADAGHSSADLSAHLSAHLSALRDGEFLLAVKNPQRLVPRGLLVGARVPQFTRDGRHAAAPPRAWEVA